MDLNFEPGLRKKFLNFTSPTSLVLFAVLVAGHSEIVRAHVPKPSQIIRFQPNVLRSSPPFTSEGTFEHTAGRSPYLLQWFGREDYQVVVKNLPKSFFTEEDNSAIEGVTWIIRRSPGNKCSIRSGKFLVSCPKAGFWPSIELSGKAEQSVDGVVEMGFLSAKDAQYSETNLKTEYPTVKTEEAIAEVHNKKVRLVNGLNGAVSAALLELRPSVLQGTTVGEEYPVLRFDQTFLSPIMARFEEEGDIVTIAATNTVNADRKIKRFTAILTSRLVIRFGAKEVGTISRRAAVENPKLSSPTLTKTITDISALKDQLTLDGWTALRALLLVH